MATVENGDTFLEPVCVLLPSVCPSFLPARVCVCVCRTTRFPSRSRLVNPSTHFPRLLFALQLTLLMPISSTYVKRPKPLLKAFLSSDFRGTLNVLFECSSLLLSAGFSLVCDCVYESLRPSAFLSVAFGYCNKCLP